MNSCRERANRQMPESVTLQIQELNDSNVAIQNLCQTQATLTSDILELARQRSELNKEIIEKTKELALITEEMHRASFRIPDVKISTENNDGGSKPSAKVKPEKKELEKKKILLEEALKRQTKKLQRFDERIKERLANSSKQLACLKSDIANAENILSVVNRDVDQKRSTASTLDRKIAKTRIDQRQLKKQLGNLDRNISEKKVNLSKLRMEEERAVEKVNKKKRIVNVLRARIKNEKEAFREMQQQRAEETRLHEGITAEVNSKKRNLEDLESVGVEMENKLRRLREEVEQMEQNKTQLAREILRIKAESSAQLKRAEEQINRHGITEHTNGEKMI